MAENKNAKTPADDGQPVALPCVYITSQKDGGNCYGDGTVYRGQRSKDSAVPTYTVVMKPEPFAWAYQNANTEHQYLVWHKQEGGRNWMPLFTLTDVQEAILAEREVIAQSLDKQADLAGDPMDREWAQEMAAAIRARSRT